MLNINTNMPSLIAQRSLNNSTKLLNQAIERMTTGFKINHASDNAANYSISTNMGVRLSSYAVAEDNVAMGLDLLSTAGGSLDLISDKLTRLRALAEQAANGTYGEQSLKAINTEANAIVDEIERIYSTAEYNGIKLFGETGGSFIEEVKPRDTSSMTKLSNVDSTQTISNGTYSISTAEELVKLAEMTNDGKVTGGEFVLANNIDLSGYSTGEGWTPIGNISESFKAIFDGNGYVISNLYINRPNSERQSLFGLTENAEIKNVGIENVNITGNDVVGGLIGAMNDGNMTNCYVTGNVTGDNFVGMLVGGITSGDISSCYSTGSVTGTNQFTGGLVGIAYGGTLADSYSNSNVTGNDLTGGLVGGTDGTITNSYSSGKVTSTYDSGGLVGTRSGTVTNSYYNKETSGQNDTGYGVGVTTAELTKMLSDGTLPDFTLKTTSKPNDINFQVGIDSSTSSQIKLNTAFNMNVSSLRGIGNGGDFFKQIDYLLNTVSAKQTEFGAAENRLDSALEEISTQYENLTSSRSTLRDADIAEVSSEYIRQQILQQASATLMATANQSPALALQLL